jgi:hypothetical protein
MHKIGSSHAFKLLAPEKRKHSILPFGCDISASIPRTAIHAASSVLHCCMIHAGTMQPLQAVRRAVQGRAVSTGEFVHSFIHSFIHSYIHSFIRYAIAIRQVQVDLSCRHVLYNRMPQVAVDVPLCFFRYVATLAVCCICNMLYAVYEGVGE